MLGLVSMHSFSISTRFQSVRRDYWTLVDLPLVLIIDAISLIVFISLVSLLCCSNDDSLLSASLSYGCT